MRLYFPELMATMDTRKEIKRLDAADLTVRPPKRQSAVAESIPEPAKETAALAIDAAENMYEARELDKAADMFRKALQVTDKNRSTPVRITGWAHRRPATQPRIGRATLS